MRVHHIAFRVGDLSASVEFYTTMLSLQVRRDSTPRSVWLGLGRDSVLMLEAREEDEPSIPCGSRELVAFRVDEAEKARIRRRAIESATLDGETEHTVYLRDPDGRRVAVSSYPL